MLFSFNDAQEKSAEDDAVLFVPFVVFSHDQWLEPRLMGSVAANQQHLENQSSMLLQEIATLDAFDRWIAAMIRRYNAASNQVWMSFSK